VLSLGPAMAQKVLSGVSACLHSVAITRKVPRKTLLIPTQPSKKLLGKFVRAASDLVRNSRPEASRLRLPAWSKQMTDPHLVLDWLEATSFLKDIRKAERAATSFARIFARSSKLSRTQLTTDLVKVDYSVLRRARVRLDAVAMLVRRGFWAAMLASGGDNLHIYVFCDASSQRGAELFAATVDVFDGTNFRRWLLPCLALGPSFMDAMGETVALLWQIFLIVGPHFDHIRAFLRRVRSLTTDMGVERKIADAVDCLKDFF
jgi:hypothetical protein